MTFAHPILALAAGLSVAVPVLIHLLLRFRRRPAPWGAMRFLMEAYHAQRKRLRLQQLLLLALRCLLLLAAGVAIARPLTGSAGEASGPRDVYVLIDNSLSAQRRVGDGGERAFDRHVAAAKRVLAGLGAGDRAALAALGGPSGVGVFPPSADVSGVASVVDSLGTVDGPADLEGALRRVRESMGESGGTAARVVVIGELRRGAFPEGEKPGRVFEEPGVEGVLVGHDGSVADNVQIVEVAPQRSAFLGGGDRTSVRVRLRRFGAVADTVATTVVRVSYAMTGDGGGPVDAGRAAARWTPGQTELDVFVSVQAPADAEASGAMVASIDRDALAGDDSRGAPLSVADSARVGVVDRPSSSRASSDPLTAARWLELALAPDRSSRLQALAIDPTDLDRSALAGLDAVFVLRPDLVSDDGWDVLGELARSGRGLAVFPPASLDAHPWAERAVGRLGLGVEVGAEKREHAEALTVAASGEAAEPLLRMLSSELDELLRPVRVFSSLPMRVPAGSGEAIVTLSDGTPWAVRAAAGDGALGEIVVFGSALSLEWSTLPATPLMVPLVQEVVRESAGAAVRRRVYDAGRAPAPPAGVAEFVAAGSGRTAHADDAGVWPELVEAGVYRMVGERGEDAGPAVVTPSARAGDTRGVTLDECVEWFASAGVRIEPEGAGGPAGAGEASSVSGGLGVSGMIFAAALALAALETVVARRLSAAGRGANG